MGWHRLTHRHIFSHGRFGVGDVEYWAPRWFWFGVPRLIVRPDGHKPVTVIGSENLEMLVGAENPEKLRTLALIAGSGAW